MALSRPVYMLIGSYIEQLFNHPVRTKSITSCVLAASANYTSQKIAGNKNVNGNSVAAYGLYGLLFGGTVPHYFYSFVERLFSYDLKFRKFVIFLAERLTFAPFYQCLSLYFLARFEGQNHESALSNLKKLFWPLLTANWKFLSLAVFINFQFVPPMLRVLTMNLVGFVWTVYIARKRRYLQDKAAKKGDTSGIVGKEA